MSPILKLEKPDPARGLEFELELQRSLTLQQRFEMMVSASNRIREMLTRSGQRKAVEIVKRTE
jgi:hypothetical protein